MGSCTVTIYVHGGGLATIYSDNNNTALANPFTSQTNGQFIWFANDGVYDQTITLTVNGIQKSITMSSILLCDPFSPGAACSNASLVFAAGNNITFTTSGNTTTINSSVPGSCTTNFVAKWTNISPTSVLGCSSIFDDGVAPATGLNGLSTATLGIFDYYTVGAGGTTAGNLVCRVSVNQAQNCAAGATQGVLGVAFTTQTSGQTVQVCWAAHCPVIAHNATTAGHWLIPSATTAGQVDDTGSTTEPTGTQTFLAESSVAGGNLVATTILSPDSLGANVAPTIHTNHGLSFSIGDPSSSTTLSAGATTTDYGSIPFGCTINRYTLMVDTGTITVKFWRVALGTAIPTSGNSINTSGVAISSGTAITSTTLSDFTSTQLNANDGLAMNVTAVSGAHFVNGVLSCQE